MFTVTAATVNQEWSQQLGDTLEQTFILHPYGATILNIGRGTGYRVDRIRIDRRTFSEDDQGNPGPFTELDVQLTGRPLTARGEPDKRTNKGDTYVYVASENDIRSILVALPMVITVVPICGPSITASVTRDEVTAKLRERLAVLRS